MFSFFTRSSKIHLDCFTDNTTAYKFAPIVNSGKAKPDWFLKVPMAQKSNTSSPFYSIDSNGLIGFNKDYSLRTIRSCFGFLELYKKGFMLESWCDMAFNVENDKFSYHYSNGKDLIIHKPNQIYPGFQDYHIIKLTSPWHINPKSNERLQFLALGAEWSFDKYNFKIMPGIVDFNSQSSTNAFMTVRKDFDQQFFVPLGQPLAQFVPLSDKKVVIHTHIVSTSELQTKQYNETGTTYGWRKTMNLVRRNEKRESKCPFGFGD